RARRARDLAQVRPGRAGAPGPDEGDAAARRRSRAARPARHVDVLQREQPVALERGLVERADPAVDRHVEALFLQSLWKISAVEAHVVLLPVRLLALLRRGDRRVLARRLLEN